MIKSAHFDWFVIVLSLAAVLYEIYRPDNNPITLMLAVNTSVEDVLSAIVKPGGDHILVKMNSTGGGTRHIHDFSFFHECLFI